MAALGLPGRAEGSSMALCHGTGVGMREEKVAKGPVASAAVFPLWLSPGSGGDLAAGSLNTRFQLALCSWPEPSSYFGRA